MTYKTDDEIIESIVASVYYQKLDELPFAVNHNNREHAKEIVGAEDAWKYRDLQD